MRNESLDQSSLSYVSHFPSSQGPRSCKFAGHDSFLGLATGRESPIGPASSIVYSKMIAIPDADVPSELTIWSKMVMWIVSCGGLSL
jgi:hypothetical protein